MNKFRVEIIADKRHTTSKLTELFSFSRVAISLNGSRPSASVLDFFYRFLFEMLPNDRRFLYPGCYGLAFQWRAGYHLAVRWWYSNCWHVSMTLFLLQTENPIDSASARFLHRDCAFVSLLATLRKKNSEATLKILFLPCGMI